MTIAMVSEHASPLAALGGVDAGGQNVHVAALATAISRRGPAVVVHTRRDRPDLPTWVPLAPRVLVHHVTAGPTGPVPKDELLPYMDDFAAALAAVWRHERPDVVHAHFWMSGRAALAAARPLGIPVVQTFHALGVVKRRHQGDKDTSPPARLGEERALVAGVDRIIATCTDEVHELRRLGADPRRVAVVPCGVDLDRFRPDGAAASRRPGTFRLLVVGRLVERKGVDDVLVALRHLPRAELVVAGGGEPGRLAEEPEAARLMALAGRLGVRRRVHFQGRVAHEDVPTLMRSADAVVCVPWYEPFGIVPVEAMACGIPVVASAVGGLTDTVVDGVTGLHVPPRRPAVLVRALRTLQHDAACGRRLGAAGAVRARERYGWDHVAAATLDVYASILDAAGRSVRPARTQPSGSPSPATRAAGHRTARSGERRSRRGDHSASSHAEGDGA
ncbi:MAG TPA: glycosyltransferase [Candidatus Binatia bacterium]|nr:glycosyltransferase [Candidatus Binatia bacterium]